MQGEAEMGRVQWELRSQLCVLDYSVWLLGQCASRDKSENHPQWVEQRVGSRERAWVQRRTAVRWGRNHRSSGPERNRNQCHLDTTAGEGRTGVVSRVLELEE